MAEATVSPEITTFGLFQHDPDPSWQTSLFLFIVLASQNIFVGKENMSNAVLFNQGGCSDLTYDHLLRYTVFWFKILTHPISNYY